MRPEATLAQSWVEGPAQVFTTILREETAASGAGLPLWGLIGKSIMYRNSPASLRKEGLTWRGLPGSNGPVTWSAW